MANFMQPIMLASAGFLLTILVSLMLAAFDTAAVRVRSTEQWYTCIQRQLLIHAFKVAAKKNAQSSPGQQIVSITTPVWVPATAVIHFDTSPILLEIEFAGSDIKIVENISP